LFADLALAICLLRCPRGGTSHPERRGIARKNVYLAVDDQLRAHWVGVVEELSGTIGGDCGASMMTVLVLVAVRPDWSVAM